MAAFLYFFEKVNRAQLAPAGELSRSLLAARGLDDVLADVHKVPADAALIELSGAGPGGAGGVILVPHPVGGQESARVGYFPKFQAWEQAAEGLWIGRDREHPPMPEDLARRRQLPGYRVELAGGRWQIPVIRNHAGGTQLGQEWICTPGGGVETRIKAEYRKLWDDFAAVVDLFFDPEDPSPAGVFRMDVPEAMGHCLAALGLNYRLGRYEQNVLHLVDDETWSQILAAAVDIHTFWDVFADVQQSKKKRDAAAVERSRPDDTPGSGPTGPGEAESCPATVPVAES